MSGRGEQNRVDRRTWRNVTSFTGVVTATDGSAVDVNQIGSGAFANHTELKWVYLPESVTTIGYEAFRDCTALEGVLIDTRNRSPFWKKAFTGCEALRFLASNAMDGQVYETLCPLPSHARLQGTEAAGILHGACAQQCHRL